MTLQEVTDKYFKDGENRNVYFHSSDAHRNIEGDTYLYYKTYGQRIQIWFGGDNGEVCLSVTDNPEKVIAIVENILR